MSCCCKARTCCSSSLHFSLDAFSACLMALQVAANAAQHTVQPMTTIERQINARLLRQIAQQAR